MLTAPVTLNFHSLIHCHGTTASSLSVILRKMHLKLLRLEFIKFVKNSLSLYCYLLISKQIFFELLISLR